MTALAVSNAMLWVVVVCLCVALLAVVRQLGVLHERIAPAGALMLAKGLKVGELVPTLAVAQSSPGGEKVTTSHRSSPGWRIKTARNLFGRKVGTDAQTSSPRRGRVASFRSQVDMACNTSKRRDRRPMSDVGSTGRLRAAVSRVHQSLHEMIDRRKAEGGTNVATKHNARPAEPSGPRYMAIDEE